VKNLRASLLAATTFRSIRNPLDPEYSELVSFAGSGHLVFDHGFAGSDVDWLRKDARMGRTDKRKVPWLTVLAGVTLGGCGLPADDGLVMACFGVVNQTVPGEGVPSDQVTANIYFGGCTSSDPGMQILERATPNADPAVVAAACDADCNTRLGAYAAMHPEVKLPLSCQTIFAASCDGLGGDVSQLPVNVVTAFQAGGPADTRIALSGTVTVTIDGSSAVVPVSGIIDQTIGPCMGPGPTCPVVLSRFDITASAPFNVAGMTVDTAQVQNQGLATGQLTTQLSIPAGAIESEVSFSVAGSPMSLHVRNDQPVVQAESGDDPTNLFSSLNLTMGAGMVQISMQGAVVGHKPVSDFTPRDANFECNCPDCTPVSFVSTASDVDQDLQSLTWLLDGAVQGADGTSEPRELDLQLPLGAHAVSLVATDTRGAAAATSSTFAVVDTTAPVVTPPPAVRLLSCSFPDIGQATASDVCSGVVITSDAPGTFNPGTTVVTWTAEDSSANDGHATQTVTVQQVSNASCCPPGTNIIIVAAPNRTTNGTPGPDCIIGTTGNDTINGMGGNDYIIGGGGQDIIHGNDGDDTILGGSGNDMLFGDAGNDRIAGFGGQDTIMGGSEDDILDGGDGDDIIDGGGGNDVIAGGAGQDQLTGDDGDDVINGGPGDDKISGGNGTDMLIGGSGNDTIDAGPGNNIIAGLDGDDHLKGGINNDTIYGGRGHNVCTSGGGIDTFAMCN
jgi:Ca2+-binding RTX toxin-like protein